jgi:hypothetical protein
LALAAQGCEPTPADEGAVASSAEEPEAVSDAPRAVYERHLVFLADRTDSTLAVPISFRTGANDASVHREIRAWLNRSGTWDPFFMDAWVSGPNRSPWRILPRGPLRLVVGQADALERVVFREGARQLEVRPGEALADWAGPAGEAVRIQEGSLNLAERRVDGWVLDFARGWTEPAPPPGAVFLLVSGDTLQVVLQAEREASDAESSTPLRAWARIDFRDQLWDRVGSRWSEARTFEPARRQFPAGWEMASGDSTFLGSLEVRGSDLAAGAGAGPILPMEAVFGVAGTLTLQGRVFPVHGIVRHTQRN